VRSSRKTGCSTSQGGPLNARPITWTLRNRSRAAAGRHHDIQKLEHTGGDGAPTQMLAVMIGQWGLSPEQWVGRAAAPVVDQSDGGRVIRAFSLIDDRQALRCDHNGRRCLPPVGPFVRVQPL
jgi:hypothetical protein